MRTVDTEKLNKLTQTLIGDSQSGELSRNQALYLALGECTLCIRSNSSELIKLLANYFSYVITAASEPDIEVSTIEREALSPQTLAVEFTDWIREPGKTSRKDSYFDLPGARLLRKVRTGMVFLQSETQRIAAGPCLKNDNQVINFINAQYMNWLQQRDWLICHAAALVHRGRALAIAAFSGGGKSTLMLHMLETPETRFLSNDRLFIKSDDSGTQAAGIPKLPRINPGTIAHNPRLKPLLPAQRHEALLAMPKDELWQLEEKFDVMIEQLYGPNRITAVETPLAGFLVLNWQHDSDQPMQLQRVNLAERRDLLAAIMKSPGPFYQQADGSFLQTPRLLDEQHYLDALADTPIFEASGRVDFDAVVQRLDELIG